ncbi:hypothetical protein [Schleiferia thermophila]|uniref:hypothetical protein n=1 Tax=Schleiferia thermophila TaxID=884107 RepID=UPI0004E79C23|nr:hypothetical protein [Schleiferia thermophila]KFD38443.1 hypothetical protein AT05_10130 [Schleiferia thermophila str. Yellowstone]
MHTFVNVKQIIQDFLKGLRTGGVLWMRVTALCVVLALVFPTFGPMGIYHLQKKMLRREVKKQLLSVVGYEELTCFTSARLMAEDVKWVDDGEFVIEGLYFDVVERIESDSGTVLYCWPDYKESELERLRTAVASNFLRDLQGGDPKMFLSYLVFIKGFHRALDEGCIVLWSSIKTVFCYVSPIGEDIKVSIFRPPDLTIVF